MRVDHAPFHIHELEPHRVQLGVTVDFHTVKRCTMHIVDKTVDGRVAHDYPANDVCFPVDAQ